MKLNRERQIKLHWAEERHRLNRLLDDAFALSMSSYPSIPAPNMLSDSPLSSDHAKIHHHQRRLYTLESQGYDATCRDRTASGIRPQIVGLQDERSNTGQSSHMKRPSTSQVDGRRHRKVAPTEKSQLDVPKPKSVWESLPDKEVSSRCLWTIRLRYQKCDPT